MLGSPVVIFGGTFDPIHHGHLRTALEIKEQLQVDRVCLIPTGNPVHKRSTQASATQRLKMIEAALEVEPSLEVSDIEQRADMDGYTISTVAHIRENIGASHPLVTVMGMDSFLSLPSWNRWLDLLDYTHLLVVARPGYRCDLTGELKAYYDAHASESVDDLSRYSSGKILIQELTPVDISATSVRNIIKSGKSPRFLLPDSVWDFIKSERLYGVIER